MSDNHHAFRGEYIDLCAHIEYWASSVMYSDEIAATGRVVEDQRYLFGEKLKVIRELVEQHPEAFARPADVQSLMTEFAPFASMRSGLAHAMMQRVGHIYALSMFDPTQPHGAKRFWLTPDDTVKILDDLRELKKQICGQKLNAPAIAAPNPQLYSCPSSSPPSASDTSIPLHS